MNNMNCTIRAQFCPRNIPQHFWLLGDALSVLTQPGIAETVLHRRKQIAHSVIALHIASAQRYVQCSFVCATTVRFDVQDVSLVLSVQCQNIRAILSVPDVGIQYQNFSLL